MAERRMFAKTIIDSDAFLEMPTSAQALYFHLCMRADDDGFINNPRKIQRTVGSADDDIRLLIAKRFIIPFESGVVVIKHWRMHNYIQSDRYKPTVYTEEKQILQIKDNKSYAMPETIETSTMYPQCVQDGYTGKVRLGKVRLGKVSNIHREQVPEGINHLISLFKEVNPSYKNFFANTTQRAALERMVKEHGLEKVTGLLEGLPEIVNRPYAPKITTPIQLEQRLGELMIFISQEQSKKRGGVVDARTK